jgi:hypothetical protein
MIHHTLIRRTSIAASLFLLTAFSFAGSKPAAAKPVTVVDEGSFGIFQNGQRVATEIFVIRQYPDSNITSSQLHGESGASRLEQTSELTLLPDGSLSRYEWKQLAPTHNSAVVEPVDQVLVMHATAADGKPIHDQTFFLTPETFILDDYFFSTREVLLWRYLASSCVARTGGDGCDLVKHRFPILIPRQRISAEVFVEFKGYDDTPLNGRPQHLRHFVIQTEGPEWHLWLDANHKLLRISIPSTNTEILRQEK